MAPRIHPGRRELGHRSRTIAPKATSKERESAREAGAIVDEYDRPTTRGDCFVEERPCPWASCKHHLYLDVNPETGSIKLNFPTLEIWELEETCALDVADGGGETLERVGELINLTRERIRQVEVRGLLKSAAAAPGADVDAGDIEPGPPPEYED
jgi:hypothetical protein